MQPATNVIPFPIIPRKPADRRSKSGQLYRCTDCGEEVMFTERVDRFVCCTRILGGCGAEMRPVEGK